MKKLFIALTLLISVTTFAQAPQGFNYQATVRNSSGDLIVNTNVYFKFNVMQGSQTSLPVFTEVHYVPTDDLGQVTLVIGQGTPTTGTFSSIDWSLGSYYLGIELDTGNGYVAMGTTQLLSVPYALYAENSGNSTPTTPNLEAVLAENNSANNQQIKDLQDPTDAQDAVTKNYTDTQFYTQSEVDAMISSIQGQIDDLNSGNDSGTVTDIDGNSYDYLTYGTQQWTAENAAMVTYRDGTPIPQVTDNTEWQNLTTGAWCYYDNDPTKGKLYNWYAVVGIHDNDPNTPNKELAPEGWHVPTDAEWTTLENYLIANGYNYDGTTTGNKIAKAMASTSGWNTSTYTGGPGLDQSLNNSSGFNALPKGYSFYDGSFGGVGDKAIFWSFTEFDNNNAGFRSLNQNSINLFGNYDTKNRGFSVRFVRDSEVDQNDVDNDGDGYSENQGDCDDTNANIGPGVEEILGNGIDDNCDGNIDESGTWVQIGQDIDGEAPGDLSGTSVSLSSAGSFLAIGATENDGTNGENSGHVRVYQNINGSWQQIGQDIDGEAIEDAFGFSTSLSTTGNILAVGAIDNDGNGSFSGSVRVFENIAGTWQQIGQDIDGEAATDNSGYSLSLSGDGNILAIGAVNNNGVNGDNSGHVRVYENIGDSWQQIGQDIDGEAMGDKSGRSVSISSDGNVLAIGAYFNDGNGLDSGHVRVYQNTSDSWQQIGQDIDGLNEGDESGNSVALSANGQFIIIGSRVSDANGFDSGQVRVFENSNGNWQQVGNEINGEFAVDWFGQSVSISDDGAIVAIGAPNNDGNGNNSGHVRVYKNLSGQWIQLGQDIDGKASGDYSGNSISLSADGNILAIGASHNGNNGGDSGHVRVYQLQN